MHIEGAVRVAHVVLDEDALVLALCDGRLLWIIADAHGVFGGGTGHGGLSLPEGRLLPSGLPNDEAASCIGARNGSPPTRRVPPFAKRNPC